MDFTTGQSGESQNPETSTESTSNQVEPNSAAQAEQLADLDSMQRFKFEGREWTPQEFKKAYLMQQDYSRKTAELAKERQSVEKEKSYAENFWIDARKVMQDRGLFSKFAQTYPDKYVDQLLSIMDQDKSEQKTEPQNSFNPNLERRLAKYERFMSEQNEKTFSSEVQAKESIIDAMVNKFSSKYTLADEATVLAQAEITLKQGKELDEKTWESIYKGVHDYHEKRYQQKYSDQFKNQKQASLKARDTKSGGGIPGQAPQKFESIRQLTSHMLGTSERS